MFAWAARIDASARVERSILWDDVVVEAGAMLKECIVTDGARVPAETSWHGVTLRRADDPRHHRDDEEALPEPPQEECEHGGPLYPPPCGEGG